MKLIQLLVLGVMVFSMGCTSQKQKDFNLVCDYFDQLQLQIAQVDMSPKERGEFILKKVSENISAESDARIAWDAIAYADAKQRYGLFKYAAEESAGVSNWQCPAMEKLADSLEN